MSGFLAALPFTLRHEGGYVDDPVDRGGATNQGVTQKTYGEWRQSKGLALRPVKDITADEVRAVYFERYWLAAKCDAVPWPLALGHFDCAVNSGPVNAWRMMQRALGVSDDGKPGPQTFGALEKADKDTLVWAWLRARQDFYVRLVEASPPQVKFLRGWLGRLLDLHREMRRLS